MNAEPSDQSRLDVLADAFTQRFRDGEQPQVSEYVRQYPELAAQIEELFPTLIMMEQVDQELRTADAKLEALQAHDERIPQLDDFRIIREVGRGGMGVVYEAEQLSLGRRVALKVLPQQPLLDPLYCKRFIREAKAAARLHHTNIVPVFGVGQQHDVHYYVMQFIDGPGLDEVLIELKEMRRASSSTTTSSQDANRPRGEFDRRREDVDDELQQVRRSDVSHSLTAAEVARSLLSDQFGTTRVAPQDFAASHARDSELVQSISEGPDLTALSDDHLMPATDLSDVETRTRSDTFAFSVGDHASSDTRLRSVIQRNIARIGAQAAAALQYAHEHGIVHRDIKPANLLLDPNGDIWVTDFGLATAEDQQDLTNTGDVLGTLRYMAPEQFEGRAGPLSDQYALGLTLYELLALRPGFDARDRHKLVQQVAHGTPVRLSAIDPQIHRDLETIVHKTIDRDPAHRYATAKDLHDDLQRFLSDEPVRARRISYVSRLQRWCKRNPLSAVLAAVMSVMLILGTVVSSLAALEFRHLAISEADARDVALRRLFDSLIAEAQASRWQLRPGQRIQAESAIAKAAEISAELSLGEPAKMALRNEVIASMSLADIDCTEVFTGLPATNSKVAFDAKLNSCAIIDFPRRVISFRRIRDLQREASIFHLPKNITTARLSPDFNWVVIYDREGVALYDRTSEQLVTRFPKSVVEAFDFSTDGRLLSMGHLSGEASLWNLAEGEMVTRHDLSRGPIKRIRLSPSGDRFAVATTTSGDVYICDIETAELLQQFHPAQDQKAWSIGWDPQGRWLAAGYFKEINVWDLRQPNRNPVLVPGHESAIDWLEFHPSGDLLATRSWDGTARIWESSTGHQLLQSGERFHQFSEDGRQLLTRKGMQVKLWNVILPAGVHWIYANQPALDCEILDGERLLTLGFADSVRLFDILENRELGFLSIGGTTGLHFLDGSSSLVTASKSGLHRWPLDRQQLIDREQFRFAAAQQFDPRLSEPYYVDVDISDDGSQVIAQADRGIDPVLLTMTPTGKEAVSLHRDDPRWISMSPDGRFAACGLWGYDRDVVVWDTETAEIAVRVPALGNAMPQFSPDSRWLAVNGGDAVRFIRTNDWTEAYRFPAEAAVPSPVAFTVDSQIAAMGRRGEGLDLVQMKNGRILARLATNQRRPHFDSLCFTKDKRRLIACRGDAGVCIWDLSAIRSRLRPQGLDWSDSPLPPEPESSRTFSVEVVSMDTDAVVEE